MKKQIWKLAAALSLAGALLAGCGSAAQDTAQGSSVSASEAGSSAQTASAEESSSAKTSEAQSSEVQTAEASEAESSAEGTKNASDEAVSVMALKGPTAMGMVEMMQAAANGAISGPDYQFTIAASPDEVTPKLVKGEVDIAAVPANLAAVLYQRTEGGIQTLAINTLGVLYIVERGDSVHTVSDLKGKTIYASGKGATPEYALNYILKGNGIDPAKDVRLEWKSEHAECLAALEADPSGIAMLPQPFVTTAQMKQPQLRVALDLTKEWDALQQTATEPSALVTGVVVARTEFVQAHPETVQAFMERYRASVSYVNENVEQAAAMVGAYDIVPEQVAKKAIPACSIVWIEGTEMKEKLSGYLQVLYEQNPEAVGGQLPDDGFYFNAE